MHCTPTDSYDNANFSNQFSFCTFSCKYLAITQLKLVFAITATPILLKAIVSRDLVVVMTHSHISMVANYIVASKTEC